MVYRKGPTVMREIYRLTLLPSDGYNEVLAEFRKGALLHFHTEDGHQFLMPGDVGLNLSMAMGGYIFLGVRSTKPLPAYITAIIEILGGEKEIGYKGHIDTSFFERLYKQYVLEGSKG